MEEHHKKTTPHKVPEEYTEAAENDKTGAPFPVEDTEFQPELSQKAFEGLRADLEKAQIEAARNMEGWQRERAEFSNYKKRIERV